MHVAFVIGGLIVGVGAVLYIHHRLTDGLKNRTDVSGDGVKVSDNVETNPLTIEPNADNSECCGMHITCERDSLSPVFDEEALYFDDEELDDYRNYLQSDYTDGDIETFREILLTLRPEEIGTWSRSIQLRGIEMPDTIRDEILMIVTEQRMQAAT